MSTTFTIYTSTADPNKVLKHDAQIALTVTPSSIQTDLFDGFVPLTWQALSFPAKSSTSHPVVWQKTNAWAVGEQSEESIAISVGYQATLKEVGGNLAWDTASGDQPNNVVAINETSVPRVFTLGVTDKPDSGTFQGLLRFAQTKVDDNVIIDPATVLQAYPVQGYAAGTPLSKTDSDNYIWVKNSKPDPKDITKITGGTTFLLYTNSRGYLVLEEQ